MVDADADTHFGRHGGDTSYDEKNQSWIRARVFSRQYTLRLVGGSKVHIEGSETPNDVATTLVKPATDAFQIAARYPELAGAGNAIRSLSSSGKGCERESQRRGTRSDDICYGEIRSREFRQSIWLTAFTRGSIRSHLCIARGKAGREGWQAEPQHSLATVHFEQRRANNWRSPNGEIVQVRFFGPSYYKWTLLALRHSSMVTVLKCNITREHSWDRRIKPGVSVERFEAFESWGEELQDVVDVAFDPQNCHILLTSHSSGIVQFWQLHHTGQRPALKFKTIDLNWSENTDELTREVSILSCKKTLVLTQGSTLVVCDSHLVYYQTRSASAADGKPTQVLPFSAEILDVKLASDDLVVAADTRSVHWIKLGKRHKNARSMLTILQSCAHNRDHQDFSLRLTFLPVSESREKDNLQAQQTYSVVLYSERNRTIDIIRYAVNTSMEADAKTAIHITIPYTVTIQHSHNRQPPQASLQHLSLAFFPTHVKQKPDMDGNECPDSAALKNCSFTQIFFLLEDRTLASQIYAVSQDGNDFIHNHQLSRSRTLGPHVPLSGAAVDTGFVVDEISDYDDTWDQTRDQKAWWSLPRHAKLSEEQAMILQNRQNTQHVHEAMTSLANCPSFDLTSRISSFFEAANPAGDDENHFTQPLMSATGFHGIPTDLFEASEVFQDKVIQSQNSSRKITTAPEPANASQPSFSSVADLYEDAAKSHLAILPANVPIAIRTVIDRAARMYSTTAVLSKYLAHPPSLNPQQEEEDAHPESTPAVPTRQTDAMNTNSQVSQLTQRGPTSSSQQLPSQSPSNVEHINKLDAMTQILQRYCPAGDVRSQPQLEPSPYLGTLLNDWSPNLAWTSSQMPSGVPLSRFDAASSRPLTHREQNESQRQIRKAERARRRSEASSQSRPQSSSQASLPASQTPFPNYTQSTQQSTMTSLGSQNADGELVRGSSPQTIAGLKRPSQAYASSQVGQSLPMRKKRRAGF